MPQCVFGHRNEFDSTEKKSIKYIYSRPSKINECIGKTNCFGAGLKRNVHVEPLINHMKVTTYSRCTQMQTENKMEQKKTGIEDK